MSFPSSNIFPWSGFSKPAIILKRVDFPQPDEPSRLNISDFSILRLTLSNAKISPNLLVTPIISKKEFDMKVSLRRNLTPSCALKLIYWVALKLLNTLEDILDFWGESAVSANSLVKVSSVG